MSETPIPEAAPSPEFLAVNELSQSLERIFNEYPSRQTPPEYNPEGFDRQDVAVDLDSSTVLWRNTSVNGLIEYRASGGSWMSTDDRGGRQDVWQQGGTQVIKESVSEAHGLLGSKQASLEDMIALHERLEKSFPDKTIASKQVSMGGLKRLFGRRHK
jgi:hypothetical protein